MKRLVFVICLSVFLALFAGSKVSALEFGDRVYENNFEYTVITPATADSNGTVKITYFWDDPDITRMDLSQPQKLTDGKIYDITAIGDFAFFNIDFDVLILPDTLTEIGTSAFALMDGITSVKIPSSCKVIKDCAFWGCSDLKKVILSNDLQELGNGVFSYCNSLKYIVLNDSNTCYKVIDNIIYNKDMSVLLSGAAASGSLTLADSVKELAAYAFEGNSKLTKITLPDSEVVINNNAFAEASKLSKISLGGCSFIGEDAFYGCTKLSAISIPASTLVITDNPFKLCSSMTSIKVNKKNPNYTVVDNILYSKDKQTLYLGICAKDKVTIPSKTRKIAAYAFAGNTNITSVTLPSRLEEIGIGAFEDCSNLSQVIFKSTDIKLNTSKDTGAFYNIAQNAEFSAPYDKNNSIIKALQKLVKKHINNGAVYTVFG